MSDFRKYRGKSRPAEVRFWEKVRRDEATGCWQWIGSKDPKGYGMFNLGGGSGRFTRAHVWSYEAAHGVIPAGLQIDHLCENKGCCNPWHLEAVTPQENTRRRRISRIARNRTACQYGHPMAETEQFWTSPTDGSTRRVCRECKRLYLSVYNRMTPAEKQRRKEAGLPVVDLAAVVASQQGLAA